jgi:hypothetical protein
LVKGFFGDVIELIEATCERRFDKNDFLSDAPEKIYMHRDVNDNTLICSCGGIFSKVTKSTSSPITRFSDLLISHIRTMRFSCHRAH